MSRHRILTKRQKKIIAFLYVNTNVTVRSLSKEFKISRTPIYRIIRENKIGVKQYHQFKSVRRKVNIHKIISKNRIKKMGVCEICGTVKLLIKRYGNYLHYYCINKGINDSLKSLKLDATYKDYLEKFEQQNGSCAICKTKFDRIHIDHLHGDNKIRGLLCFHCNAGIGMFKDNPLFLREAALYLEKYSVECFT